MRDCGGAAARYRVELYRRVQTCQHVVLFKARSVTPTLISRVAAGLQGQCTGGWRERQINTVNRWRDLSGGRRHEPVTSSHVHLNTVLCGGKAVSMYDSEFLCETFCIDSKACESLYVNGWSGKMFFSSFSHPLFSVCPSIWYRTSLPSASWPTAVLPDTTSTKCWKRPVKVKNNVLF